ncbi:MAG: thymidylate synthase [Patescibacteria group bacterium]
MKENNRLLIEPGFTPMVHHIVGSSISYCWYVALDKVITDGRKYKVEAGSFEGQHRLTLPLVIEIHKPWIRDLAVYIPEGSGIPPPTTEEKIYKYFESLITPDVAPDQHYTYGQDLWWQVEEVIAYFKKHGFGSACGHMIVGRPESLFHYNREVDLHEMILVTDRNTGKPLWSRYITNVWNKNEQVQVSSQCLRSIDCWVENGKLHFWIYFRSWDLRDGFPENVGGFQLLKEYMKDVLGLEDGPMIVSGKDVHVYEHGWHIVLNQLKKNEEILLNR